ncbi:MAG: hypothetical protein ABIH23_36245 [bacterium]
MMNLLSRIPASRRERILHYLLVGATFLICYLLFGYWNVTGSHGSQYGYGCYDIAPLQAHDRTTNGYSSDYRSTAADRTGLPKVE